MPDKNSDTNTDESADVERRIDAMMDPRQPDPPPPKSKVRGAPELPEIDIFKDSPTPPLGSSEAIDADQQTQPKKLTKPGPEEETAENFPADIPDDDTAVDDIVAHEGDELLAAQDAEAAKLVVSKPSLKERIGITLSNWWNNKPARYGTLTAVALLAAAVMVIPTSRYAVLSAVGVRSSTSITILDNTTSLPLKNVSVSVGTNSTKTNADGLAKLSGLTLGTHQLTIRHLGFAAVTKTVTLGLGSNPLGNISLRAVGTQYKFIVTDYVSGKPVTNAEAGSGEANAQANDKGEIILTVGKIDSPSLPVTLSASGYRDEKVTIDVTAKVPTAVIMVTKRKEIFVSKQSGNYDVYKMDIDGKNKQVLLAGTGIERPAITLVSHPTDNVVAVVSSRDNKRNQDGYLLDTLTLVNVDTGAELQLDQSEQIKIVDWISDKLVYVKVKAGTSAGNTERYQMISYDYSATKRVQLATANYFADIVSAKGALYYATGNYYQPGQSQFVKVSPDGTGRQVLLNNQVWNILRTNYNDLYLASAYMGNVQDWYSYHIGDSSAKTLPQAPADANTSRFYLDAPDGKRALWTEVRDGKGVLLSYDASANKDTVLATAGGLNAPLRWLDSRTVIYRIATPQETADYVVSLDGGTPHKISDVTNAAGLGQWNPGY